MKKIRWTELIIFVVSAELTGAISALLAGSYKDFYSALVQPPLAPPSAVFPWVEPPGTAPIGCSSLKMISRMVSPIPITFLII